MYLHGGTWRCLEPHPPLDTYIFRYVTMNSVNIRLVPGPELVSGIVFEPYVNRRCVCVCVFVCECENCSKAIGYGPWRQ